MITNSGICIIYAVPMTKPPSAREPVSPMNTLAGYTLNRRNPSSAPTTAQVIGSTPLFVPIATTVKNVATSTVTLEARPSRPSVKFVPFTVPITAINISGIATHELLFAAERTEAPAASERKARLVILIDDIGESKAMLREFLALDIPMAFAVLPHSTHARECAGIISRAGHELLLHHPMEPERFPAVKPGPGAVYAKDNEARIAAVLEDNMARVPGIKGLNNHMGSKFTGNARAVDLFLRAMSGKGLFVVDSLTSPDSKLYNAAKRMGIKAYRRDVFLDDVSDRASIRHELEKAARLAQTQGHALAIGHPRPETLAVLKEWLKTDARGITFSRLEDL